MGNNTSRREKNDDIIHADSHVFLTQYSSEASQLIKSFTKNIPLVVVILIIIASMTVFDLAMDLGFIKILSDEIIDAMIIIVAISLIGFIIFTVRPILRAQKILEKWSNLFENNSIRTSILLTINNKSKEEILNALSETIEEIDTPLQSYLSKSSDHTEFYNVSIDETTIFDILIDTSTIKFIDTDSDLLKNAIRIYGGILIKITDNVIDKNITQTFLESLQKYKNRGNKIGLAIIIGENIADESYSLINKVKDKNIRENLILIDKPNSTDPDLKNLDNVLT
jgi:hypothetical protein